MPDIPWAGMAALAAMFVIPFLPDWLFEGPRTVKHWPRHHVCGDCGAVWTDGHTCVTDAGIAAFPPLRAELRRSSRSDSVPWLLPARGGPRSIEGSMRNDQE